MRYTKEILKKYGINISIISEKIITPKLIIYHDDGYTKSYYLTLDNIKDIKNNSVDFLDDIIDNHIKTHVKYIRKKKLLKLDEI